MCKVCLENLQNFTLRFAIYSYEAEMCILGLSWLVPSSLNILQIFLHILIGNVKNFHKMYINHILTKINCEHFFTI